MFALPPHIPVQIAPSALVATTSIPNVPFYSQFKNITSPVWQKVGCGVASLAMIVDYYKPAVSVDTLLSKAVSLGAYDTKAGWTYSGLIGVAKQYGLEGSIHDLGKSSTANAFAQLVNQTKDGPVIASVHYKFDPKNPIPHLVVINGVADDVVYYNDPAAKTGEKTISTTDFLKAWKKRYIVIRPAAESLSFMQTSSLQSL